MNKILLLLVVFSQALYPQEKPNDSDTLRALFDINVRMLVINKGVIKKTIKLEDHIHAKIGLQYEILFNGKEGSKFFLLLNIYGNSKISGQGYCGAGIEEDLIYIKMDSLLNVEKIQSELVASCFNNIDQCCIRKMYDITKEAIYTCHYVIPGNKFKCIVFYKTCPSLGIMNTNKEYYERPGT